jgi:signal transduction histidine kinase
MAEVSVEDQGMGMTEEDLARLFQKFFRSDRTEVHTTPGTGLGLYITKNLLELQGGSIRAASTPGRGTTMTFTLPLEQRVGPGSVPEAKGSAQVGR